MNFKRDWTSLCSTQWLDILSAKQLLSMEFSSFCVMQFLVIFQNSEKEEHYPNFCHQHEEIYRETLKGA